MEKLKFSSIHFIGIGGIGMSALARWALSKKMDVSGYDAIESDLTKSLEAEGATICYEKESINFINNSEKLVVYTPAISKNHPQIVDALDKKIKIIKRAELLGYITKQGICLAVAGTHGKTTTSCLLAWIIHNSGIPVQGFFGGISKNFETNYIEGEPGITIVEADEFDRSFLHLEPSASVITSTDPDHLDYYKTHNQLERAFKDFAKKSKKCFVHKDVKTISGESYGLGDQKFGADNILSNQGSQFFDLILDGEKYKNVHAGMAGEHNIENAIAASVLAKEIGVSVKNIIKGIESFEGVKRRFEILVSNRDNIYIDDYAHHPTEIKKLINSIKKIFPGKPIAMLFQPHLFSRTQDFIENFKEILSEIDMLGILPIYAARENPIPGINSEKLVHLIPKSNMVSFENGTKWLCNQRGYIKVTAGAGDIDRLVPDIVHYLKKLKNEG
jgi:UDP-N-acetylmuramate--alanine ligase